VTKRETIVAEARIFFKRKQHLFPKQIILSCLLFIKQLKVRNYVFCLATAATTLGILTAMQWGSQHT